MKALDVMGVIIDITDQETVKLKNKQSKIRKYITIIDKSSTSISITLWGEMCEKNNNFNKGDTLAVKGARVSEFGGKSLNAADDHAVLFHN